jgi:hypothetical protein
LFYPLNYGNRKIKERINGFEEVEQAAPADPQRFPEPPFLFSTLGWKQNYQLFYFRVASPDADAASPS